MWTRAIHEFIMSCPQFEGRDINVNYLGYKEGDCSLEPIGETEVVKIYCDGKRVLSCDFCIGVRCGFDENSSLNIKDVEFLEKLAMWLEKQGSMGILPELSEGFLPVAISIKRMPHLFESSVQGARMQLEFTFTYREI